MTIIRKTATAIILAGAAATAAHAGGDCLTTEASVTKGAARYAVREALRDLGFVDASSSRLASVDVNAPSLSVSGAHWEVPVRFVYGLRQVRGKVFVERDTGALSGDATVVAKTGLPIAPTVLTRR